MVWRSNPADSSSWRPLMRSILLIGIGMPMIKASGGRDALERARILGSAGEAEQALDRRTIGVRHRFEARVGAERTDLAANVDHRFGERITQRILGIAADDQATRHRHEGR